MFENVWIAINFSLKFDPKGPVNNISALVLSLSILIQFWNITTFWPTLWPGDAMWRRISRSTLAQVMACCLPTPSHYPNQNWLIIDNGPWYSPESNFTAIAQAIFLHFSLKIILLKLLPNFPGANELKNVTLDQPRQTCHFRDKMTAILQTTFSNALFLNESVWISIKISTKFLRVQLTIFIGSDNDLVPTRRQAIIWSNDD